MSRPATLKVGNTSYWTIMTYTSAGVLVDADSTPTVVVYKNGSLTADVVTITKRSATTGIYDAYYNPASEAEGDCFTIQETATISSQAYVQSWSLEVFSDVEAVKAVTDKIDTMLESDSSDIFSGFESGFDGWTAVAYFGGNASHTTVSTAQARTGNQSIRMINDGSNGSNDRTGIVRTETFGSGATVSGYFYSTNSFASSEQRIEFWVDGSLGSSQNPTAGQTWEAFSFNVPTGSHDIALVRYSDENNSSSQVHLDDITITGVASTDYQYTAESLDQAPSPDNTSISAILADTADLQANQGQWLTATGFSPSRYYTFADSSGTDYVDVYTEIGVVKNLPKVQKAIVRLKLSGTASSSSDWRLKLHVPSGNPSSGFDLLDGVTLPTSLSNYILQAEVDITSCDNVDGSWSIVFEDFNYYGSVLSIDDAAVEFSDVPIASVGGDATAANQTAISNAIAALNDFDPLNETVANVTLVATTTTNTDMRGTDGANTVTPNTIAPDNAGITANGTAISSLNNITVQQVWDALESGTYASGSFGERLLVSQGTHRTVQVTGSNHVAADVHEFQNDSITASAIAADAVTELQTGLVTVGTAFTYTNGAGDTHNVTIS
jgi:hypothetical protein